VLRRLAATGVSVAIDDFGSGNTSLAQLRDLPVQALKIDRTFVADADTVNGPLLKVMTDLAHEFGLQAVAEGVETEDVADRLRLLGCDQAQGWLFGRPEPAAAIAGRLRAAGATRDTPSLERPVVTT
jgi:EAL domain-containing protein (putative c-di-GMP-specific phosphodiesterase class I)